ncbi:MAG: polysaccharide biosynthesis/export family protein [Candidatus Omnitrophota bacterium]
MVTMKRAGIIICLAVWSFGFVLNASELEVVEEQPVEEVPVQGQQPQDQQVKDGGEKPSEVLLIRADDPAGVATPAQKTRPLPAPVAKVDEPTRYTLGPEDVLEIIVRRHTEFSGRYHINGEGKIQYKFVGDIEVAGLTKTEVKDRITQILAKFIINPDVDVTILEYRSKVIYVIGEVGAPGKYYMKSDKISLREAVVQAGLPTLSASMRRTQLIRPDKTGAPKESKVDLYALLYEGKLDLDRDMIPGDVLVVPATLFAKIARIINPIAQPVLQSDSLRRAGTGGF